MKKIVLAAFIIIYCSQCSPKGHEYEYVPLSDFKDDSLLLKSETPVKLLAFSGGKDNDKDNIIYYQFIVISQVSGDTLNVLTPLLKIPHYQGMEGGIYVPAPEFNPGKKIFDATFERKKDTLLNLLVQTMGDVSQPGNLPPDISGYNKIVKKELVSVNNSLPGFKNNYKTVVGILAFDQDPR